MRLGCGPVSVSATHPEGKPGGMVDQPPGIPHLHQATLGKQIDCNRVDLFKKSRVQKSRS